jgi:steroid 5-alpha reductase family enzyme
MSWWSFFLLALKDLIRDWEELKRTLLLILKDPFIGISREGEVLETA